MPQTKATAAQRVRQIDPRGLVGSTCLWAWVDTMYRSGFFSAFGASPRMAETAVWLTFLLIVPLSIVLLAMRDRTAALFSKRCVAVGCGVAGSAGSALLVASAAAGSWPVMVAGSLLAAVFMGMSILQWGALYCREGEASATMYVAGGFACALLPDLTFLLMAPVPAAILPATLPFLSGLLYALMPEERRVYCARDAHTGAPASAPAPAAPAGKGPLGRVRLALGVSVQTLCSLALIMMGLGYMHHKMSFAPVPLDGADVSVALQVARGVISAALFALALLAPKRTHLVYRLGLLAIIAGFSLMPLLAQTPMFWVSGAVVLSGYTTFDVLIWVIVAQVAYAGMSDGLTVTCAVRMLVSSLFCGLGGIVGIALDEVGTFAPFPYADAIFVGYLMTIATVLVLSGRDVWELFDARPAPQVVAGQKTPDEALAELSSAWGLTEREREVFGFLAMGRTQPWVAERLSISESTVNSHVRHIYAKAGVNSRQGLLDLVFHAQSPEVVDTAG